MPKTLAPSVTAVTARDPKGLKFVSIVEAAYNKATLSDEEAQRVNDTPDLAEIVGTFIAENRLTDKFKSEETKSSYGYPLGYKVKDLVPQSNDLRGLIGGVGFFDQDYLALIESGKIVLPEGAEGWFAIPHWQKIAPTYNEAVKKILALIASKRNFYNWREGQLGPDWLREHQRTTQMFDALAKQQKNAEVLIVPAQFGLRHRGRSVRRAREVFASNEFGLGAFAVGCMLLTHPEREAQWEQLHVDCAGDEYSPDADGRFGEAPLFYFRGGRVWFVTLFVSSVGGRYGSASGFLPQ